MRFSYRPAKRQRVPLLLGVAGGTGSGKTYSALRLARGIAGDQPIFFIDTENGRALHYADDFDFQHGELHAPFRPSAYADAIEAAEKAKASVIVVDSASHEWAGDGGMLDWQEELMRGEESRRLMSWIEPKKDHKRLLARLLQVNAHVILCFRAEPKVDMVKGANNRWEIVPKKSLVGLDGWIPISEKMLPYELTASFLLMADQPGVPKPIKLPDQLKSAVPLDRPLDESVGKALLTWADGSVVEPEQQTSASAQTLTSGSTADPELVEEAESLGRLLIAFGKERGNEDVVAAAIASNRSEHEHELQVHVDWLKGQIERAQSQAVTA